MECKGKYHVKPFTFNWVLIETLWNVKKNRYHLFADHTSVLIETLWNVKNIGTIPYLAKGAVLIETLWNVKSTVYACLASRVPY